MEPQPRSSGETPIDAHQDRRPNGRPRLLVAGVIAIALTALTAIVAINVNFGAASAQVPSEAGRADRTALEANVIQVVHPAAAVDAWGRPSQAPADAERRERERGHDDDD